MLILGKPLGIGVLAAAIKRGVASAEAERHLLHWASLLNKSGQELGACAGVHAMTDVTGYGLIGHLLEVCEASGVGGKLYLRQLPVIEAAQDLLAQGVVSSATRRNRDNFMSKADCAAATQEQIELLCDPQTNGGLLVACAPAVADEVLSLFRRDGCGQACVIGEITADEGVRVCT